MASMLIMKAVKESTVILIANFLIMLVAILVVNANFLKVTYYSRLDMFGPLSRHPLTILAQFSLPILLVTTLLKRREASPIVLLIPFMSLITVKYMGVELTDAYYITGFYDAVGHFRRGFYVAVASHSNPHVDAYFDTQPGFFWVTGILLNAAHGTPNSLVDSTCVMIVKWFHIFAIMVYIPICYMLYKRLLNNPLLVSVALLLHFGMEFIHFHYAAQQYGRVLYWLILLLIFNSISKRDFRYSIFILLVGISLTFLHQGVAILTILALIALIFYPAPFKIFARDDRFFRKEFFALLLMVGIIWLSRLIYLTIYTFGNFAEALRKIIETLMAENVQIIPSGIDRANAMWCQIVSYKAIYIFILVASGLILSFVNAYCRKEDEDKLAFSIQLLSAVFFGSAAIAVGGAGYIERLPSLTMPLITCSIVKYVFSRKIRHRKLTNSLVIISLITLIFLGSTFYLSGRNFQSVTYGEYYSNVFLANNDPQNMMKVYERLKVAPVREVIKAELSNKSVTHTTVISIQSHDIIQTNYYICADISLIKRIIKNLQNEMLVIYSNPDAVILLKR